MRALRFAGAAIIGLASTAAAQDFGPDAFGYIGNAIPGNFIDITAVGTDITPGFGPNLDDAGQVVGIGFSFDFYGSTISSIAVATNGYLADDADLTDFTNDCPINNAFSPNRGIYPFWDDLRLTEHGQVFTITSGTGPNRVFIAQFQDVGTFDDSSASLTFQAVLNECDDSIEYHYQSLIDGTLGGFDASGGSASIGIEDNGANGLPTSLQISCDTTGAVANGDAFRIEIGVLASQVTRLGTPPNPGAFNPDPAGGPFVGTTWSPSVSPTLLSGAQIDFVIASAGPTASVNMPTPPLGTLLCNLSIPLLQINFSPGVPFDIMIPNDCGLAGVLLCAQGGSAKFAPCQIALANALDCVIGNY